ncbi:hypothetical protein [Tenacibaculum jejuense]|uniref:Uncharacterized protein n=1 Tax=Tenacibaculum jejuense TaxID=584609 RepID=A0A238UAQ8_9FLAO|nr:hypothetical protein [Tenacibaculum jejuense]SNR16261.1 Probable transmembrane protein of unknown function [Tenacibaculum jejuense]
MKQTITPIQEFIFVLGLMTTMGISMLCLAALSLDDAHRKLLKYFSTSGDLLFISVIIIYMLNNYIGMKAFTSFYRKRVSNKSPQLVEDTYVLKLEYSKEEWTKVKKAEYLQKKNKIENRRFVITLFLFAIAIFFCFIEFTVGLIVGHFIFFFALPFHSVIKEPFQQEYYNNILFNSNTYVVKIYQKGLTVNDWYCGFNHYHGEGASTTLTALDLIEEESLNFLQFTTLSQAVLTSFDDFNGGEVKHTATLKIPVLEHHQIDMNKLKKKLLF